LANDCANVCGLFHRDQSMSLIHDDWQNVFQAAVWSDTLRAALWDESSFCSVAALTMDRHVPLNTFAVGDAAAMIPPLTGNGMSMAFESAEAALPHALGYCRSDLDWDACVRAYSETWRREFSDRLRWAAFVQRLVFHSSSQEILFFAARFLPAIPNVFFSHTR
jgi:2-polyprenyl-6-methoxyphenol hydroxylase-like FAD-dependent oxidoreductase